MNTQRRLTATLLILCLVLPLAGALLFPARAGPPTPNALQRSVSSPDAEEVELVGHYDTPGYAEGVAVANGYAYVADGSEGLRVIDVSDPTNPREVGGCGTSGAARGVAMAGGYAYVAAEYEGLRVIDVSDPTNPHQVGSCAYCLDEHTYWWYAKGVAVASGYAYVAAGSYGLIVTDVSDPTHPECVGDADTPGYPRVWQWPVALSISPIGIQACK